MRNIYLKVSFCPHSMNNLWYSISDINSIQRDFFQKAIYNILTEFKFQKKTLTKFFIHNNKSAFLPYQFCLFRHSREFDNVKQN